LRKSLKEFTWFYNKVPTHQSLNGRTPLETWIYRGSADARATQLKQWVAVLVSYTAQSPNGLTLRAMLIIKPIKEISVERYVHSGRN
jgi:hypothetical protein